MYFESYLWEKRIRAYKRSQRGRGSEKDLKCQKFVKATVRIFAVFLKTDRFDTLSAEGCFEIVLGCKSPLNYKLLFFT